MHTSYWIIFDVSFKEKNEFWKYYFWDRQSWWTEKTQCENFKLRQLSVNRNVGQNKAISIKASGWHYLKMTLIHEKFSWVMMISQKLPKTHVAKFKLNIWIKISFFLTNYLYFIFLFFIADIIFIRFLVIIVAKEISTIEWRHCSTADMNKLCNASFNTSWLVCWNNVRVFNLYSRCLRLSGWEIFRNHF